MFHFLNWGGMWFGNFFGLVLIGLVIWLVVKNNNNVPTIPPSIGETPLDIIKKRYAKGEISGEEFERMKKELES